jgi:acetolactate synthase I/III small subunit
MSTPTPESRQPPQAGGSQAVLELTVNNHPGVMSHICGLFARRAYNVEGILCLPIGSGAQSRIWLLVHADHRLEQMIKQVHKLEDVLTVQRHGASHEVFGRLEEFFRASIKEY